MNQKLIKAFLPAAIPSALVVGFIVLMLLAGLFSPHRSGEPSYLQVASLLFGIGVFWIVGFVGYFLPTTIAAIREKKNYQAILVLNLLGFLVVTWIIALVWAFATEAVDTRTPST